MEFHNDYEHNNTFTLKLLILSIFLTIPNNIRTINSMFNK